MPSEYLHFDGATRYALDDAFRGVEQLRVIITRVPTFPDRATHLENLEVAQGHLQAILQDL